MPEEKLPAEQVGAVEAQQERQNGNGVSRRDFLQQAAVAAGTMAVAATTGCAPKAASKKGAVRWGMVVDLKKCVGCRACTVACKAENHTPPGVAYNVVLEEE